MQLARGIAAASTVQDQIVPSWLKTQFSSERIHATGLRLAALVLVVVAVIGLPAFRYPGNVRAIVYATCATGTAAAGLTLITLSGNLFMLSIGATSAVATLVFASTLNHGLLIAVLATLVLGGVIGFIQGLLVGAAKCNPIITTIAVASIITGLGSLYSNGQTILGVGDVSWLGVGQLLPYIPNQLLVLLGVVLVYEFLIDFTVFGREIRLLGTNPKAAVIAGLRTHSCVVLAYSLAGVAAGLSGALLASQASEGNLQLGAGLDFDAIAAVLIGGVSIKGGRGKVSDAAFGALFLSIVGNILLLFNLAYEIQLVVKGLVVLLSVTIAHFAARSSRK
ncbi:MAG: ABC transporter permease [Verrucomicrobia bacterium]|nr:ABC transporter permease [Verrucomicrobiota bacterium]